jgi:gas vesicle protein
MNETRPTNTPVMFVMGLAIGMVVAALITPRNGDEMRRSIKNKVDTMKDKAKDKAIKTSEKTEEKMSDAISAVQKNRNKLKGDENRDNPLI